MHFRRSALSSAAKISIVALIIACLPLFTLNCINGHDISYHLLRIEALKEGMKNHLPFLRVNLLFFNGEGYASSLFYPDFLLYLPAFLRFLGVGINLSYHIFVAFCIITGFLSAYFCMKFITGDPFPAVLSAVILTLCQYHIDDIYTRSAVGEYTALIFFPLVTAGLYDLMHRQFKHPCLLGAGMAGVLLCHTLTTLFSIILCFAALIFSIRELRRNPKILLKLLITAVIVLALTSFYWLPMLEQLSHSTFAYVKSKFDLDYEKLLLKDIFKNTLPGMGISIFILLFPRLFISKKAAMEEKRRCALSFGDFCLLFGILFTLATTGLFPWKRAARFLNFVQFPWRLFIIASPLLAFSAGIYLSEGTARLSQAFIKRIEDTGETGSKPGNVGDLEQVFRKLTALIVLSIMIFSAVGNFNRIEEGYYSYSDDYFEYPPHTKEVIGGEWLPIAVTDRGKLGKPGAEAESDITSYPIERKGNSLSVSGLTGQEKYLDVPFIYYYGYAAYGEDKNAAEDNNGGKRALITDGNGENGRVRVYPGGASRVTVIYEGTFLQQLSSFITIIMAVCLAVLVFILKRWKKTRLASKPCIPDSDKQ